jgi:metal-sulfur cluster biosynthetic enzyme
VKDRTEELEEVSHTNVKVVFDPPWEPSEELKGMMGLL